MMDIGEAIKHCYEEAESSKCAKCSLEHLQLAHWLEELKQYREQEQKEAEYLKKFMSDEYSDFLKSLGD